MTRLEYERRRRGLNQTAVAYHAHGTQSEVSLVECRRLVPTRKVAERLALALGLQPTELLDEVTAEGQLVQSGGVPGGAHVEPVPAA